MAPGDAELRIREFASQFREGGLSDLIAVPHTVRKQLRKLSGRGYGQFNMICATVLGPDKRCFVGRLYRLWWVSVRERREQ